MRTETIPMNPPRPTTVSLTLPAASMLWTLGIILLADALVHALLAMPFANFPGGGFFDYSSFVFALVIATALAIVAGFALVFGLVFAFVWAALRGHGTLRADDGRFAKAVLFIHVSVLIHSVAVSVNLLAIMEGGIYTPLTVWPSLASAALVLAFLNGLKWSAVHAAMGAAASAVAFGCAVWYAPDIYGWDLQPLGRYAILTSAIPVLAFLALFLRRAPVFSKSRWLPLGAAIALFAALAYAVGLHMAANPPMTSFSESLRTALSARPNQIKLSELTDFEWDTVELYNSYTMPDDFSAIAREGTDIVSRIPLGYNEVGDLAVFIKDGEVVYYEMVWQNENKHTFLFPGGSPVVLTPQDAVFNVEYRDSGYRYLSLAE